MSGDRSVGDESTRRTYLTYGGTLASSALLAGCLGGSGSDGGGDTATATPTGSADQSIATETTEDDGPYSVTMSPVGTVEFDTVPADIFTVFAQYADMAVALGRGDAVNALYVPEMSGTTMNHYYHHLDGVSFDWEGLHDPLVDGLSKERLYELDSDVHLADPAWASTQQNWDRGDVDEVGTQVAPWFGNFYSGTQTSPPEGYPEYEYYDLWELFGGVARVFREEARYEALAAVHADLVERIQSDLPPEPERPTAVRVSIASDGESFYTYHLNKPGYWLADTRPLGATDAFADEDWGNLWGQVDFEAMVEADPDVLLHLWGMTPSRSMAEVRQVLADHPVGRDLTAVQNDRVHAQGMRYQGPIMNLFQLEMTAKQLYPQQFGAWPTYEDGDPYPEIPEDEQLFDRQRVADIVRGEVDG